MLSLQRCLHISRYFNPRTRNRLDALPLRKIARLVPQQLQHDMAGCDISLLRTPVELPKGNLLVVVGNFLRVVVAGDVAEAEEWVIEAILEACKSYKLLARLGYGRLTIVYSSS